MSEEEIHKALEIIGQPITVNHKEYHYFDQENYDKLFAVYNNCLWFIRNFEQINTTVERVQQENQQLKEELQKADSITQSCIFEGKEESAINFRECLNKLDLYKKVIEEVREYIEDSCYYPELENYSNMTSEEVKELLQILDKAKGNK